MLSKFLALFRRREPKGSATDARVRLGGNRPAPGVPTSPQGRFVSSRIVPPSPSPAPTPEPYNAFTDLNSPLNPVSPIWHSSPSPSPTPSYECPSPSPSSDYSSSCSDSSPSPSSWD